MALDLFLETRRLLDALDEAGVEHAVAGAIALAVHGVPRATSDIDVLIPEDRLEAAIEAARASGFSHQALPMTFPDGMRIRRVTRIEGDETLTLDLLLVGPNLEEVWETRQRVPIEGGEMSVVSREGLIRMKAWAGRDQDLADIRRLEELDR